MHLRRDGDWAEFPDCVTARGARHLRELTGMVAAGHRAVMLYVIQRDDCRRFRLADDLDPAYARAFAAARDAGVEAIAHATRISRLGIWLDRRAAGSIEEPGRPLPEAAGRAGLQIRASIATSAASSPERPPWTETSQAA